MHHVGVLCENLERSLAFYKDLLGRSLVLLSKLIEKKNVLDKLP